MSDADKKITQYRCPVCDEGFALVASLPAGVPYFYCESCIVGGRAVPQISQPYSPHVGFEAVRAALSAPGAAILEGLATFVSESVVDPTDTVIVYGSGDGVLQYNLRNRGIVAFGYEPRADYWPALKQSKLADYTLPTLTGAEAASVKIFVGLDDLWMENAPHILAWFNPQTTIVSPPLYPAGDPTQEQFGYWLTGKQSKYFFTPSSFYNWVDILFPPPYEPMIDCVTVDQLKDTSIVRITNQPS